jgi:hypothetical protein
MKNLFLLPVFLLFSTIALAHDPNATKAPLQEWHLKNHRHLHASFLMMRNDTVFLQTENDATKAFPLRDFSKENQGFILEKEAQIVQLNQSNIAAQPVQLPKKKSNDPSMALLFGFSLLSFAAFAGFVFFKKSKKLAFALSLSGAVFLLAFKTEIAKKLMGTDPLFMDAAFQPFKPHVATHWDNTWFYVESNGIPTTHPMMAGITKWQQQVPIQQCYIGSNAWQIPLNPVLAATPVPVNAQHFLRGAVAIAANGIPIFNPYTNTGVDAFLDGQLDQWGGHCGRADDYHYHIAPMFLDTQSVAILPIAFGLDGFAVYASLEPDGSPMLPLDANHGHFDAAGIYHYHGSAAAPYMIGNMVGQVTEDATTQIIPQAKATPVRPSLTPLTGATITDCTPNAAGNGYTLTYTRNGQTYKVEYSWTIHGVYTYNFISPTGTITETYNGHLPCEVPTATQNLTGKNIEVRIFPNPSTGGFFVKLNDPEIKALQSVLVFNSSGQLVYQKEQVGAVLEISGLTQGAYFLKISFEHGEISRKIIVQ